MKKGIKPKLELKKILSQNPDLKEQKQTKIERTRDEYEDIPGSQDPLPQQNKFKIRKVKQEEDQSSQNSQDFIKPPLSSFSDDDTSDEYIKFPESSISLMG